MQTTESSYDFNASLERIDEILNSNEIYDKCAYIPSRDTLTYQNGYYVNCSAIFIDICGSSDLTNDHTRPVLAKIYRTFISESIAIMRSISTVSEVSVQGDAVWGVYNTTTKDQINQLISILGELESLIDVLNYKLSSKGYKTIQVGIGLDYGRALMVKAGYKGSGINDVVWMGDVVNKACHLASYGNSSSYDRTVMISRVIYINLSDEYKKLFIENSTHGCYHADLCNVQMNHWLEEQRRNGGK